MRSMISVILQMLLILAIGVGAGFAANAARKAMNKPAIVLDRQYFHRPVMAVRDAQDTALKRPHPQAVLPTGTDGTRTNGEGDTSERGRSAHPPHEFQTIDTASVAALVSGEDARAGSTIIVDARDDKHFREGHIPGAYPCYFSNFDQRFEAFREFAVDAGYTLVIYCNGGECEDSINLCRMLVYEKNIPSENVLLYEDGWEGWKEGGYPIETGERGVSN